MPSSYAVRKAKRSVFLGRSHFPFFLSESSPTISTSWRGLTPKLPISQPPFATADCKELFLPQNSRWQVYEKKAGASVGWWARRLPMQHNKAGGVESWTWGRKEEGLEGEQKPLSKAHMWGKMGSKRQGNVFIRSLMWISSSGGRFFTKLRTPITKTRTAPWQEKFMACR